MIGPSPSEGRATKLHSAAALSGYLELPEGVSDSEREAIVRAFREWVKNGRQDTLILMHGARYVPWSAWEPQAIVTRPDETRAETIRWLVVSTLLNSLAAIALALAVILR